VVGFYLLSGFVMTALIRRHYARLGRPTLLFYVDRSLRLLPQYLLYVGMTWALVATIRPHDFRVGPAELTLPTLAANLAIVPLDYFSLVPVARLIPPAWSLGLELHFYALAPFLLALPRLRRASIVLSVIVFGLAHGFGLQPEILGYQLLPGTLFIFLSGSLLFEAHSGSTGATRVLVALWASLALLGGLLAISGHLEVDALTTSVLLGYLLGLPLVWLLARKRPHRLDDALGAASYGAFLAHWLCIWAIRSTGLFATYPIAFAVAVMLAAAVAGWASYLLVERPVLVGRRRLRSLSGRTRSVEAGLSRRLPVPQPPHGLEQQPKELA
jgi:peptidoglycan/LPS O-acetylase OafA/YrhL